MGKLTKEEILAEHFAYVHLDVRKKIMNVMDLYAQQFERPDNDSGQGWISVEENWLEDEIKKCDKDIAFNEERGYTWSRLESVGRKKMLTEILNKK